jgi:hypothetical protein
MIHDDLDRYQADLLPTEPPPNWRDRGIDGVYLPSTPKAKPAKKPDVPPETLRQEALQHLRKAYAALAAISKASIEPISQDEAAALQSTLSAGVRLRAALAPSQRAACKIRNHTRLPELEPLRFQASDGRTKALLYDGDGFPQIDEDTEKPVAIPAILEMPEAYRGENATMDTRFHIIAQYSRVQRWKKGVDGRWVSVAEFQPHRTYAPIVASPRPMRDDEDASLEHKDATFEYIDLERGERWKRERERSARWVAEHPRFYGYRPERRLADKEERALAVEWLARVAHRLGHRVRPEGVGSLGAHMDAKAWIQRCRVKVLTDPGPLEEVLPDTPNSVQTDPAATNTLRIQQEQDMDFVGRAEMESVRHDLRSRPLKAARERRTRSIAQPKNTWRPALQAKGLQKQRLIETLEAEDARRRDAFLAGA